MVLCVCLVLNGLEGGACQADESAHRNGGSTVCYVRAKLQGRNEEGQQQSQGSHVCDDDLSRSRVWAATAQTVFKTRRGEPTRTHTKDREEQASR
jgi:hypothetical protein